VIFPGKDRKGSQQAVERPLPASGTPLVREVVVPDKAWTAFDRDDCTVVALAGELSLDTAADLLVGLCRVCGARCRVVVDLTAVTFIDSVGLGVLLEAQRRTRSAGGWMRLVCTDPQVLRVLRLTDLDDVFTIVDTVEQARAAS
jgi:anti-sigma B factor antagonist